MAQELKTRIILRNDTSTNWATQNPILKQGEMGVETDTNKFKFGKQEFADDGKTIRTYKWNELSYGSNIPADAIYFDKDITLAGDYDKVGNIALTQGTLEAKDKSVAKLFEEIFTKTLDPKKVDPYVSSFNVVGIDKDGNERTDFEAGSWITPKWTATFNLGSYSYKSAKIKSEPPVLAEGTGVALPAWTITGSGTAGKTASSTSFFEDQGGQFQIGDSTVIYTVTATHGEGYYALTNLNTFPKKDVKIAKGDKTRTDTLTSYRKMFAGGTTNTGTINSSLVRTLPSNKKAATGRWEFTVGVGATRVIVAFPQDTAKSATFEMKTMAWNPFSGFKNPIIVQVEGLNGFQAVNYVVYEYIPAGPFKAQTPFAAIMKE